MTLANPVSRADETFLVLKVGGSLVSDKRRARNIDTAVLERYAKLVADLAVEHPGRMVFVAGGGAFGHGAVRDLDENDPLAALVLTEATFAVKWAWTTALRDNGVRAMPLQLAATCLLDADRAVLQPGVLRRALDKGILPVLSGDSLLTDDGDLRVFGSDRVPGIVLGQVSTPIRIVTLTDVPGVLTGGPGSDDVLPYIDPDLPEAAFAHLWDNSAWDTSGSMGGKIHELTEFARRGAECLILRGTPDVASLRFLLSPVAEWPADISYTRIARSEERDR